VDSAVIRIVKRESTLLIEKKEILFLSLVKEAFRQKRKTLVNNWHQAFSIPKESLELFLINAGFNPNVRAEALTKEDFIKLTEVWNYE
jgi:16S rRNA (adenine1518-N6/adenine1519-N6)-dimethyltransferase